MEMLFDDRLPEIPTLSIKGAVGMALGAAGAIQTATAAIGLKQGILPPTVNWEYPDPGCPFRLAAKSRPLEQRLTLINSHGLGGTNACLVLESCSS